MKKMLRTFLKKFLPWIVAVGIFAYLFNEYPPSKVYNSLKYINIYIFFPVAITYFILMFVLETFSVLKVLGRFGYKQTMKELLPARGTTYLVMIVNYAAAQVAFAFYQYRKHGLPIATMLGIFGIIVIADLLLLATLAFITTFFTTWPYTVGDMNISTFIRIFVICAYAFFALLLLAKKYHTHFAFFEKLKKYKIVELITNTNFKDYIYVGLIRLPVHVFIMSGMYIAFRAFGMDIQFIKVLSNIPIIFFIGALPITPGGLGVGNAAIVELFKSFISSPAITSGVVTAGELLFSFSLAWMFVNYSMKALTGLVCFKFVSRDLFKPTPETTAAEAEEKATPLSEI